MERLHGDIDQAAAPGPGEPPPGDLVGRIRELWRYPVKSMRGSPVPELQVTTYGSVGDRAWALRDPSNGRIASAKRFSRLLDFRASYEEEPTADRPGRVRIEVPDGRVLYAGDRRASEVISEIVGRALVLVDRPQPNEKTGIDRNTVFGDVPIATMKPDWTPATMPDFFQLKSGSFFEIGAIYLLTSGSVDHMRALSDADTVVDLRRFRPNVYVDTGPDLGRFVEDEWICHDLAVGPTVVLDELAPTLWCVTSTLAQEGLPHDRRVLRTMANTHKGCLGVYASVRSPGTVRVGDPVRLR